jgi:hypothetical protein
LTEFKNLLQILINRKYKIPSRSILVNLRTESNMALRKNC